MQSTNTGWGAPRIHGELLKLGFDVSQATVSKYMQRSGKPPSQTWLTFLANHVDCLAAIDFFTVPTATFRVLCVFVVLSHDRRHVVHFNVTEHSTARWTAQQIMEAFPFDTAPSYLLRDQDRVYGERFQRRIRSLCIEEVFTAPRSPWQNAFVERVIGSIRRNCLDHVIVLNEQHLRRILREYFSYYHTCRTHLSLNKDPPETRAVESPEMGNIVAFPRVGGLHHQFGRIIEGILTDYWVKSGLVNCPPALQAMPAVGYSNKCDILRLSGFNPYCELDGATTESGEQVNGECYMYSDEHGELEGAQTEGGKPVSGECYRYSGHHAELESAETESGESVSGECYIN